MPTRTIWPRTDIQRDESLAHKKNFVTIALIAKHIKGMNESGN